MASSSIVSRKTGGLAGLFASLLFLASCSNVNFSGIEDSPETPAATTGGGGNTCTGSNVEAIYRRTKILFLVDASGSNVQYTANPGSTGCGSYYCTPPTDPEKTFRGGAIADFFQRFRHKTNFDWGFGVFSGTTARALINAGSDQNPVFANDPNRMSYAISDFYSVSDKGATPYKAAIALADRAIRNDPELFSASRPSYFVVFLTDGFPTDYYDANNNYDAQALSQDVERLMGIAPGQVSLSTIYYGQVNDPHAIQLLKGMAAKGGGQFASVNDPNSGFKIDDVIPGSQQGCP